MSVNLKSLAATLGLSQTTVSRGLNGYDDVAESTRRRIQEAAQRLDYRPNARAQGLATGRSMVIGHVIPTSAQHEMVNPIFADFVAGVSEEYARQGYKMLLIRVDEGEEHQTYRQLRATSAVDGVVLQGPLCNDPRIEMLCDSGLPFVVHGRSSGVKPDYCWVDVNNRRAFERATDFLIKLGHRRIALINGTEQMDFAHRRRMGYLDALHAAGIEMMPELMVQNEMTEAFGYLETTKLLGLARPPTAILVSSFISALGVRRAIEDANLRMGHDISVITHDDMLSYLPNGISEPVFTATRSSVAQAGRILANILLNKIANPNQPPQSKLLEAELVLGQSTGPYRGNNAV